MRIELRQRSEDSRVMVWLSPLLALALTLAFGSILFAALGYDPLRALYVYFIKPLTEAWSLEEIVVKATPLALIGVGLAVVFRTNVWNIGAEGPVRRSVRHVRRLDPAGGMMPRGFRGTPSGSCRLMLAVCGTLAGIAYAADPGFASSVWLRRLSEILTSTDAGLCRAELLLDWHGARTLARPGGLQLSPRASALRRRGPPPLPALAGRHAPCRCHDTSPWRR